MEKQMGCMAGFLQIFDRHQLVTEKRLPPATESEPSPSPAVSKELGKPRSAPSPNQSIKRSPVGELESPAKSRLTLLVFDFKEDTRSSWKFSREAPRLSLDSRATVNAKGSLYQREIHTNAAIPSVNRAESFPARGIEEIEKQRRSTSVIAKLMGLEPPEKNAELRRSASKSRASKDFFHSRFLDSNNFHTDQNQSSLGINIPGEERVTSAESMDLKEYCIRNVSPEPAKSPKRGFGWRKSFFEAQEIFPEPKHCVTVHGDIERRLKTRGIDEAANDLEVLKHILEALQLKGLLHSGKSSNQPPNQRSFVYDQSFSGDDSPIVLMKSGRSPDSGNRSSRYFNDSPASSFRSSAGAGRNVNDPPGTFNSRRERHEIDRNVRNKAKTQSPSPTARSDGGVKSPGPLNIESQRKRNDSTDQRRSSPAHSAKVSTKRTVSSQQATNTSPRNRKPPAETYRKEVKSVFAPAEDESSYISESSISTPSQTDTERSKIEEYKDGRSLLNRCNKLLLSIAEITSTELQPSPVSVLDSSFYKEEESSSSPPPVIKRSIDFTEVRIGFDADMWSPEISLTFAEDLKDSDFVYVLEIYRALGYSPVDSYVFHDLEKQQFLKGKDTSKASNVFHDLEKQQFLKGKDTSKASKVQRKLIFDAITEILDRNRSSTPWKAVSCVNFEQTWSEFRRIRERGVCEDLFEVICGVLRKDLAGDAFAGWGGFEIEMSEAVLGIERMVFKDLVGETIRDLAASGGNCSTVTAMKRKLVF